MTSIAAIALRQNRLEGFATDAAPLGTGRRS